MAAIIFDEIIEDEDPQVQKDEFNDYDEEDDYDYDGDEEYDDYY